MAIGFNVSIMAGPRSTTKAYSSGARIQLDTTIANSVTDQLHTIAIDVSQLVVLYMMSSTALTIETNSASAPDDTFVLTADVPYLWTNNNATFDGADSVTKLAVDVTALYLTNASGAAANFYLECIYDDTP